MKQGFGPKDLMGSGWFCYPGKLKQSRKAHIALAVSTVFRMVLLSGEVETRVPMVVPELLKLWFRMVLLSGEVETARIMPGRHHGIKGSGWFCYPGKLKRWAKW